MFLRALILTLIAIVSMQGTSRAQDIDIDIKAPGYTDADAMVAIDIFRRKCQPLGGEFWGDVTSIQVEISEESANYRRARGWKNSVWLRLNYSQDPKFGPSFASGAGVLAGHTLHYFLGGGETPGFFASKQSSQYLCGLSFAEGKDIFVDVPEFKFLDR